MSTPKFSLFRVNTYWIVALLFLVIICFVTIEWSQYPNFTDRMAFAATLASLLLAVLAITYAFVSNNSISSAVIKLTDTAESLSDKDHNLGDTLNTLDRKIESLPGHIEKINKRHLSEMASRQGAQSSGAEKARADLAQTVTNDFLRSSSWNGLKVLKACSLSADRGIPFELDVICSADARMSFDYAYGYLVASSCVGFFGHVFSGPRLNIVTISNFQPYMKDNLENTIEGFIAGNSKSETETAMLKEDCLNIVAYFDKKSAG